MYKRQVRHIQPGKTTCCQRRTHNVLRQEGKTHALLHHLAQQRSACLLYTSGGDAYVDHPSFGTAIISRLLEAEGYKIGVLAQPRYTCLLYTSSE